MKQRIAAVLTALVMFGTITPMLALSETVTLIARAETSGTCGENLTWTLDEEGTLTISGTGDMNNYAHMFKKSPWGTKVKSIILSDGLTSIGDYAFHGCSSLTSVAISNSITSIGNGAFQDCTDLTSVTIPEGVTSIGECAFAGCAHLSITIPPSVTSIGANAIDSFRSFLIYGCEGSSAQTYAIENVIPFAVIEQEKYPSKPTILDTGLCGSELTWVLYENGTLIISGTGELDSTGAISPWKDKITSIIFNEGLTKIKACSFMNYPYLTSVLFSSSIDIIYEGTFWNCPSLSSATIPDSVRIDYGAFKDCDSLTIYGYKGSKAHHFATSNRIPFKALEITEPASGTCGENLTWELETDGTLTICGTGEMTNYDPIFTLAPWGKEITVVILQDGVTNIGDCAFDKCPHLNSVKIPNTVTSIGKKAFMSCPMLTSVTLSEKVANIGYYAFEHIEIVGYKGTAAQTYTYNANYYCTFSSLGNAPTEPTTEPATEPAIIDSTFQIKIDQKELDINDIKIASKNPVPIYVRTDTLESGYTDYGFGITIDGRCTYEYVSDLDVAEEKGGERPSRCIDEKAYPSGLLWFSDFSVKPMSESMRLALFMVKIPDNAQSGDQYNISFSTKNPSSKDVAFCQNQLTSITYNIEGVDGWIRIVGDAVETTELGDVNGDTIVNASDAATVLIASAAAGAGGELGLTEAQIKAADVNEDSTVNASDAAVILIYSAAIGAGQEDAKITDFVHK
ncbi:MAG: leucine-rich repeat protein [Oscillospiraceae bacterium]|nr:leucine-rich repeat protein [Oscillospiraceae bacterium]